MDKWIHNAVANNIRKGKISENEAEIYEYGYTLMVEKIIIFVISAVIALILDAIWEVIALCIAFIPLRVYSGGYHAKSRWGCMVLSGMFVALGSVGIKLQIDISTYLLIEIVCIGVISKFAPVGTDQKQISDGEECCYRKRVIVIAGFELLLGLICFHFKVSIIIASINLSAICNMFSVLGQVYYNAVKETVSAEN